MCKKINTMENLESDGKKYNDKTNENKALSVDEALDIAGFGKYNYFLLFVCSWSLQAMGMDMFGVSFTVTAAACDLKLDMKQRGYLFAMPFVGVIAGAYIWGYISDTRGRKLTLMLSMGVGFIFASLSSLSTNWQKMAAIKFMSSCFTSATHSAAYTLLGESCPARYRSKAMLFMSVFLMFSQGVSAMLSYPILPLKINYYISILDIYFTSWRLLIVVMSLPCAITTILLSFFNESPKYLAYQGREEEALNVLRKIYSYNTGNDESTFGVKKLFVEDVPKEKISFFTSMWNQTVPLFKPPLLKSTLQLFYITSVVYMTGSGFIMWLPYIMNKVFIMGPTNESLNMCNIMNADKYISINSTEMEINEECDATIQDTTILSALIYGIMVSCASLIISLVSGQHKKIAMILILCISAVSCLLINLIYVPIVGVLLFFFILKVALTMGLLSVYFVELYPTHLRGMVSCLSLMIGRGSAFIGVNIIGIFLANDCSVTFYVWILVIGSALVCALFLPKDINNK